VLTAYSLRCIQVIAGVLGRAGEAGQKQRLAAAANGTITYQPATGLVLPGTEGENEADENTKGASPFAADGKADELEKNLDDVRNHEDHRLKGGRELKASS
jgi:small subunit ribosomal protein S2